MAIVKIPFKDSPSFTEDTVLNGVEYRLRFDWNTRSAHWSMSIYNNAGLLILAGIRLVIGYPLLNQFFAREGLPNGQFFISDSNPNTMRNEPGRNDFTGDRKLELCFIEGDA